VDTLSYKTLFVNKNTISRNWYLVDAEGEILGRLASNVAKILRGKNKPDFTPHVNSGDKVVIINAEKIRLTGNKLSDKVYIRHTGYPGGQRFTTPREILSKKPENLIIEAIRGMMPKSRLRKEYLKNLFVYTGTSHPHTAQKPVQIEI